MGQMNRNIQAPLTLPKHPELLRKINQMSIDIALSHLADEETVKKLADQDRVILAPTWKDVRELLRDAYNAINEQREDPRKY